MNLEKITKADLAEEMGVSRAYITMIANGTRKPSAEFVNKMESLGFTMSVNVNNLDSNALTLNQQVTSSILVRLISPSQL
jgi:transcriptional regulator with XRE-family HTH domain